MTTGIQDEAGQPAVLLTVLVEEVGSSVFHGSYGIEVEFDPQNLTNGDGSITEIQGDGITATALATGASCTPPGLRVQCTSAPA